ncbi:MAG: MFS transporter [Alphaproteobacteria bacterium]|jgi:predicted MFS family arabinose efflux permease|nr:MFS transporter [Alphaproteobacteria bacterium]MBT4016973.1 MFS transporter [Alphaproteobacteria bacterium]MBT4965263.1 MFS transporter [Alphaproteobacteria bacterium]MBT5162201.1 MFS transporter [Alphaproteobacteria bacterium]MBT5917650.1 MFS transporter [Alphaproteobacteria bacterium]
MNSSSTHLGGHVAGLGTGGKWAMLVLLMVARTNMGLQFQTVADASEQLVSSMGISWHEIGRLIGLYMLPGICIALLGALLGRKFGDKNLVVFSLFLMALGGALMAVANSYGLLSSGRILSGVGGVVVNVLMTKMIADWFPGKQVAFAMAILIVSWPLGLALGLVINGQLLTITTWPAVMWLAAGVSLVSMALVWLFYRNPPALEAVDNRAGGFKMNLSRQEVILCCLAGCVWSVYNVGFIMLPSFGGNFFISLGFGKVEAAWLVSIAGWLLILLVPVGGYIGARWGHQNLILFACFAVGIVGMAWIPLASSPVLVFIVTGSIAVLPAGLIMSLPAQFLRPQSRGAGMGLFFTMYYVGFATLPEIGGWARDVTGDAGAPIQFGATMFFAAGIFLVLFLIFKRKFETAEAAI